MIKKSIFFALALSLAFSVLFSGDQFAEASDPQPTPPAQKVPPLKDDIDNMMQQRAVQRSAPLKEQGESETSSNGEGEGEGGDEAPESTAQEPEAQE
ncbi:MAG: hypothetical protein HQ511_02820 [Rhodospirillales bacterium]|nr:hypothetical protein [Rhodospirillales bacterium]